VKGGGNGMGIPNSMHVTIHSNTPGRKTKRRAHVEVLLYVYMEPTGRPHMSGFPER
jgi:hypothetical protein